jgi:hypothetical protein
LDATVKPKGDQNNADGKADGTKTDGTKADGSKTDGSKGGHYTEEQWYNRHVASIERKTQEAHEKFIRQNANVDPREGQAEEEFAWKLERKREAALRRMLPKPDVDPYPPDFEDSRAPAKEVEIKLPPVPAPNVDPVPPDVQPEKPKPLPPPGPEVSSSATPRDGQKDRLSSLHPDKSSSPLVQPDTRLNGRIGGGGGRPVEAPESFLYCSFEFDEFRRVARSIGRIELITQDEYYLGAEQAAALKVAREELNNKLAELMRGAKGIEQLASSTFLNPPIASELIRRALQQQRRQITIFQKIWGPSINDKDGMDDTFKYGFSDDSIVVGLNSFGMRQDIINLLPDYEALGTTLALRVNAFDPKRVIFILPTNLDLLPTTSRMIIGAAKVKLNNSIIQSTESDLSSQIRRGIPFEKTVFVYLRRSGTDREGRMVSDIDAAEVSDVLDTTGSDRVLFVSVKSDGFNIRGKVDGLPRTVAGGTDRGLAYWIDPIRSVLGQLMNDNRSNPLPIKKLNGQNRPALSDLVRSKETRWAQFNVCFVSRID